MAVTLQDIPIGAKADIETQAQAGAQENRLFVTRVDSTNPKSQEIRILAPLDMLTGYRIRSGEMFRLFLQMNDMLYQVWCVCLGYERSNQTILLVARLADNAQIENANRRNDFRVRTVLEVDLWRRTVEKALVPPGVAPEDKPIRCLSTDVSVGGVGLLVPVPLEQKELVVCRLTFDKGDIQGTILFNAECVRCVLRDRGDNYSHAAGLRIRAITQVHESLLLRYSLACQREALRLRNERG